MAALPLRAQNPVTKVIYFRERRIESVKFDRIGPAGEEKGPSTGRGSRIGPSRDCPRWLPVTLFASAAFYLIAFWLILG